MANSSPGQQGYSNINNQKAVSTYNADYYSGCDVRIYMGDLWVDDIITIQWGLSNAKTPRYSYGDPYYKAVSQGNILVEGNFVIAFRELGYLTIIHNRMKHLGGKGAKATPLLGYYNRPGPESSVIEPVITAKTIRDVLGDTANQKASHRDFEAIAETMEDRIWGISNKEAGGLYTWVRPDQFDMITVPTRDNVQYSYPGQGFDLVVEYGDYSVGYAEHTLHSIHDIHITGSNQVISPNGEPIGEMYTFFGKMMDESVADSESFVRKYGGDANIGWEDMIGMDRLDNMNEQRRDEMPRKGEVVHLNNKSPYYFPGALIKLLNPISISNQSRGGTGFDGLYPEYNNQYGDIVNWADWMAEIVVEAGMTITKANGVEYIKLPNGTNIPRRFAIRNTEIDREVFISSKTERSNNILKEVASDVPAPTSD